MVNEKLDIRDAYKEWTPLWIALRDGYIEMAKLLIEEGADLDILWTDGTTPLNYAKEAGEGYNDIVELITNKQTINHGKIKPNTLVKSARVGEGREGNAQPSVS